jgi:hypothetical protein
VLDPSLPSGVVSLAEAAHRLYGIRPRDVMRLVDEGELTAVVVGNRLGIETASIDALLHDYETAYGVATIQAWFDRQPDSEPFAHEIAEADVRVRDREDGLAIVAVSANRQPPGAHLIVGVDRDHRLRLLLFMEPETPLGTTMSMLAEMCLPGEALMVVTNRTGEVPADRPDDELLWEEMLGATTSRRVVLLDWWILWGTKAFSAAEFAPSGPGWQRYAEGLPRRAS